MAKGKKTYWWGGLLILAVLAASTYCIGSGGEDPSAGDAARADRITIDVLKKFGSLDKPEVVFLHDLHTDAMAKEGADCTACHLSKGDTLAIPGSVKKAVAAIDPLSPKFKRLEDTARKEVMDTYHKFCIECHTDMKAEKKETGPITCGGCHKPVTAADGWKEIGFDKSLHSRHNTAMEKKCEACHHVYDEDQKKTVYKKGAEGSCRHCHKAEPVEKTSSLREAAHLDCISCHRERLAKKISAGPVKCAGCHAAAEQAKIEKLDKVPRMERNQPDATLVSSGAAADALPGSVVAFNHKAHEEYNDTCRVCHHASMDKCSKCHTIAGAKDGGMVKLSQAFHNTDADASCLGCHATRQKDPKCAGCHVFMEKNRKQSDESCLKCHDTPSEEMLEVLKSGKDEEIRALAHKMMSAPAEQPAKVENKDIPEKVVINSMVKEYEAVELPHRKIVERLRTDLADSKMAAAFHGQDLTLCQGCHHNSPASVKPPKCASCHGQTSDERQPMRPGLLGAYHQQCMTCHVEMKLEKPAGCLGCHKENKAKM